MSCVGGRVWVMDDRFFLLSLVLVGLVALFVVLLLPLFVVGFVFWRLYKWKEKIIE